MQRRLQIHKTGQWQINNCSCIKKLGQWHFLNMISGMVLSDSSSCAPAAEDDWGDDQGMIFKVSDTKDGDDWGTILKVSGSKSGRQMRRKSGQGWVSRSLSGKHSNRHRHNQQTLTMTGWNLDTSTLTDEYTCNSTHLCLMSFESQGWIVIWWSHKNNFALTLTNTSKHCKFKLFAVILRLLINGIVIGLLVGFDKELPPETFTDYSYEVSMVV